MNHIRERNTSEGLVFGMEAEDIVVEPREI